MGSSTQKYHERLEEEENKKQIKINKQYLSNTITGINKIDPLSDKFKDFQWVMENYEKIIRNRQLINLIG